MAYKPTIKMLWGIAKSAELSLTDEELHLLVSAHTGKESIRALTQGELRLMVDVLNSMKDAASRSMKGQKQARGNLGTANQRRKIYKLAGALGWERRSRIDGFCKRMFGVERLEWLDYRQCSRLIEALKCMAEREVGQDVDTGAGLSADA